MLLGGAAGCLERGAQRAPLQAVLATQADFGQTVVAASSLPPLSPHGVCQRLEPRPVALPGVRGGALRCYISCCSPPRTREA